MLITQLWRPRRERFALTAAHVTIAAGAVSDANGVPIRELPITPERVSNALPKRDSLSR